MYSNVLLLYYGSKLQCTALPGVSSATIAEIVCHTTKYDKSGFVVETHRLILFIQICLNLSKLLNGLICFELHNLTKTCFGKCYTIFTSICDLQMKETDLTIVPPFLLDFIIF